MYSLVGERCLLVELDSRLDVVSLSTLFMFDSLTVSMCVVVTFISFLVHLYSTEYMSHDPHLPRFMSYLSLFTFFMLILVTADNFLQMFVGWEGVGLCSYLLINFWFTRIQANKAAIKAMILNRIGDFSLLISILLIFINYKSIDYATVAALTPFFKTITINFLNFKVDVLSVIGIFMFIGATGKSAQLILHTWLPDAMEGERILNIQIYKVNTTQVIDFSFFFNKGKRNPCCIDIEKVNLQKYVTIRRYIWNVLSLCKPAHNERLPRHCLEKIQ
jgi:NADH:ubiquinone oxidoreductase subunit 5 (subunit L)/multisubunit Na+/H+ antiporter MnhA subunit